MARRGRGPRGGHRGAVHDGSGDMAGPEGLVGDGLYSGLEEFKLLAAQVREVDDRLRRVETLLFHIPVPDIQRIIKVIEAAGLEDDACRDRDARGPAEAQPEQEVAPEEQDADPCAPLMEHLPEPEQDGAWAHAEPEAAHERRAVSVAALPVGASGVEEGVDGIASRRLRADGGAGICTRGPGGFGGAQGAVGGRYSGAFAGARAGDALAPCPVGARGSGGLAREELQAQQEFKDNVLGAGPGLLPGGVPGGAALSGRPGGGAARPRLPQVGEIWRFTGVARIFQLFDDELGRASASRMGPTNGARWRAETRSYPQPVTVTAAPAGAELVKVRGRGETESWLKGWVRLRDEQGRPLLEPDTY